MLATFPHTTIDLFMKDAWPSFEDDLKERPDYTIACIGLAMYRFVAAQRDVALATDIPKINARINYFGAEIPIGAIDARYLYSMPQWLNITNGMKITQIQNMVRARARMDLSAEITTEHVMDTIRIVSRSWYDKYDTDDRNPSVQLPSKGQTAAKPATVRKFLDVLRNHSKQLNRKLYTLKDLRALISEVGVPGVEDEIIEKLNIQGYLLKKGAGRYELLV
uniref:MCM AAA-lid domain-containing protein n=1 Tax=Anopheles culicifacies TaxID=139723 RepID=A0A182MMZ8_9DIPT